MSRPRALLGFWCEASGGVSSPRTDGDGEEVAGWRTTRCVRSGVEISAGRARSLWDRETCGARLGLVWEVTR